MKHVVFQLSLLLLLYILPVHSYSHGTDTNKDIVIRERAYYDVTEGNRLYTIGPTWQCHTNRDCVAVGRRRRSAGAGGRKLKCKKGRCV